jgi:putative DNA primase/helicase
LLNVENGTVDLHTGRLLDHKQEDLITKLCPVRYDPDATHETWDRYLRTVTGDSQDVMAFLQRAVGYSLTGDVSEEKLFFVHGPAASGKSTFLEAVRAVLGDF